jgi:hypothetical protein
MRPGFTARLSEPPACTAFDLRRKRAGVVVCRSPRDAFGVRRVNAASTSCPACIPLEPETRNGLSLTRNDAISTITGSLFLACTFVPAPEAYTARSIHSSPLGSVSKPKPGEFVTSDPLPLSNPALPRCHPAPTPLWAFKPSGSKRSTGRNAQSPPCLTSHCSPLPAALLSRSRFGSLETPVRPARLSFRKPWNCLRSCS